MVGLHLEGHFIGETKMHEGYAWRLTRKVTKKHTSYMWNVTRSFEFDFCQKLINKKIQGLSTRSQDATQ